MKSGRKTMDDKPEKITLHTFLENNHKILSVLGVFTALTVFSRGLPLTGVGQILSLLFLTLTILLWLELMSRYPTPASARLSWFENLVTFAIMFTAIYWLMDYNAMLGSVGIGLLIMFVVVWVCSLPLKFAYARLNLPSWARSKVGRWGLFILVIGFVAYPSLMLGAWVGGWLAPPISKYISQAREEFTQNAHFIIRPDTTQVAAPAHANSAQGVPAPPESLAIVSGSHNPFSQK